MTRSHSGIIHRSLWSGLALALALSLSLIACSTPSGAAPQPATAAVQPTETEAPQPLSGQQPAAAAQAATPSGGTEAVQPIGTTNAAQAEPPPCTAGEQPTPAQTEGPYYRPNPPERPSLLEPGMAGTRLVIGGYVLTTDCTPVAGARVDFWQADDSGNYDNSGYTLRGYQLTDDTGRYSVETVIPGLYPGRTRHIHVKVQPPDGPVLTTQLYFEGETQNGRDSIFNPRLVLAPQDTADGKAAEFNFYLPAR